MGADLVNGLPAPSDDDNRGYMGSPSDMSSLSMMHLTRPFLQTLQEDGRAPFTQIAKQAGVSETTIRNRYQNLVEAGIVRTVGIVDPYALDFDAPAIIGLSVEPGMIDQVARKLIEFPEASLVKTLGPFDLIVEVFCRDLSHINDLLTHQIHLMPGVRSTETFMITQSYKLSYRWSPALDEEADAS